MNRAPVHSLGFTNIQTDYTTRLKREPEVGSSYYTSLRFLEAVGVPYDQARARLRRKYADEFYCPGWLSITEKNRSWMSRLIYEAQFSGERCDEHNLSGVLQDLRIAEIDVDNHEGRWTFDEMSSRRSHYLAQLDSIFSDHLKVYQVMVQRTTGSFKLRFVYSGTLIKDQARVDVLSRLLRVKLNMPDEETFDLIMRGNRRHLRTRLFSAQHDFYNGDLSRQVVLKSDLVVLYEEAQRWLSSEHQNLSSLLILQGDKPTFHRRSGGGHGSTERDVEEAISKAPSSVKFGAGTRFESLPAACRYIARCGHKHNETAALHIYKGLDHGSKDLRDDPARATRDLLSCLRSTAAGPIDFSGEFESQAPNELRFDQGAAFRRLSPVHRRVLLAIGEDRLSAHYRPGANRQRALRALPRALELVFSKHQYEQDFPIVDRAPFLSGTITMNFGGKEKDLEEFRWVDSSIVFQAVIGTCLRPALDPTTGRDYNYLKDRFAKSYHVMADVNRCLLRHLRLGGRSSIILHFNSLTDFSMLVDGLVVTQDTVTETRRGRPIRTSIDLRSVSMSPGQLEVRDLIRFDDSIDHLLKRGSFELRSRLTEVRSAIDLLRSVRFYDRHRLRRLYCEGMTIEELRVRVDRVHLEYSNQRSCQPFK